MELFRDLRILAIKAAIAVHKYYQDAFMKKYVIIYN